MTKREQRRQRNEDVFRSANEPLEKGPARLEPSGLIAVICECSSPDCTAVMRIGRDELASAHAERDRFVIVPGHDDPTIETVVETHAGFAVVDKRDVA